MATIRLLLGIICLAAVGGRGLPSGHFLNKKLTLNARRFKTDPKSFLLLQCAIKELGVREQSGKNDGARVEAYLHYVGLSKGDPWCAAFVSWVFGQNGYAQPRTGWSPALFPLRQRTTQVKAATVFGIYFPELKRIAHCGMVERVEGNWLITIEGNTNVVGSREGDGVYRKRRAVQTVRYFANWIGPAGEEVRQ